MGMAGDASQFCAVASFFAFLAFLHKNTTTPKTVADILNIRRQREADKCALDTVAAFTAAIAQTEAVFTERMHIEWRARVSSGCSFSSVFVANCPADLRLVIRTFDGVSGFVGPEFVFHQAEARDGLAEQFQLQGEFSSFRKQAVEYSQTYAVPPLQGMDFERYALPQQDVDVREYKIRRFYNGWAVPRRQDIRLLNDVLIVAYNGH